MLLGVVALADWGAAAVARWGTFRPELAPAAALGAAGIAYYAVYAVLGVPPYRWYYVPTLVALSTSLVVLLGAALRGGRLPRRALAVPGLAVVACFAVGMLAADVRGGAPWRVPPIFGIWLDELPTG